MATDSIDDLSGDRKKGEELLLLTGNSEVDDLGNYKSSEANRIDDAWFDFCESVFLVTGCFSVATNTYYEDYLLCMHYADQGNERALETKQKYLLWKLTS